MSGNSIDAVGDRDSVVEFLASVALIQTHLSSLVEYQAINPALDEEVFSVLDFRRSIAKRDADGGTAPQAVQAQIQQVLSALEAAGG